MNNRIDEIQRQYMYAVQPVKMFEAKNAQAAQNGNPFSFNAQNTTSGYNPFHPDVSNSNLGGRLDLMG